MGSLEYSIYSSSTVSGSTSAKANSSTYVKSSRKGYIQIPNNSTLTVTYTEYSPGLAYSWSGTVYLTTYLYNKNGENIGPNTSSVKYIAGSGPSCRRVRPYYAVEYCTKTYTYKQFTYEDYVTMSLSNNNIDISETTSSCDYVSYRSNYTRTTTFGNKTNGSYNTFVSTKGTAYTYSTSYYW